ncbi:MAG: carboxylesterase/lipase family protein [Hyphomonadaceae bacterium]|nr:carboxylesterase/lipase family protein [Hyphomonadaceae bacterium]
MESIKFGSRRAVLKAGVAIMAFAGAGAALAACEEKPTASAVSVDPIVETKHGKVKGFVEDGVTVFKGVRYGADTATTRFQPPKAPEAWTDTKDALAYANSAPQPPSGNGGGLFASWRPDPPLPTSEDCLFLNVWTPATDDKKRPVMVWFHGGGFATGSGSSYAYDGVRLAKRGDVVVVTTNHRLNLFGYLNLSSYGEQFADSGAVGALDMIQSLEWVRDNIEKFGGDPNKVLIFGESGGGSKVCTLMAMDKAKGLFHRAVVQSGPRIRHQETAAAGKATDEVVKKLGLAKETIADILAKPVADIQAAAEGVAGAGAGPSIGLSTPRHPFEPDAAPQSNDVPLLIGCNRTEGTSLEGGTNPALFDVTFDTVGKELQRALPGRDVKKIIDVYRKNHPDIEAPELYFMATADNQFFRNSVTLADRKSAAPGGAPVFFYHLDWKTPVMEGKRYVPHALDIGMAFDNIAKSESMSGTGPEAQAIADQMSESWLAFARNGDPRNDKVPEWPNYTAAYRHMMVFRSTPGLEIDIRAQERAITAAPGT